MGMGDTHGSRFARTGSRPPRAPVVGRKGPYEHPFLPTCRADLDERGWDSVDIIIVSGDAYVDHPAFGPVLIARFLEGRGYRVGILAQPDWRSVDAFKELGRPNLFFGVSAGNLDSMLNRLTAQKKNRAEDQYSPGGRTGCRPDRATMAYAQRCREAYRDVPVILGGIEASLRRVAHYDYWSDKVRRSILLDAKADMLIFGMGERPILEVARRLAEGEPVGSIRDIRGTAYVLNEADTRAALADTSTKIADGKPLLLPAYDQVRTDKAAYARMAKMFQMETNPLNARPLLQEHGARAVYYNPPALPLQDDAGDGEAEQVAMDQLYDLPFNRTPHPMYNEPIPAFETVKHSVVTMRGCFGGCTFCSITEHEGRVIQSRSSESVLREIREIRRMGDFRGTITDLGGPTANMYKMKCSKPEVEAKCRRLSCVHPFICPNLGTDHGPVIDLMEQVREADGVKHVFIASGVRTDLAERSPEYVKALATHHVGGHLSVAPEHVSKKTLKHMKKPPVEAYERFTAMFRQCSTDAGKEQYEIPYFISGHPGCTMEDMIELALWLKAEGYRPRQVQDFIPTPMSIASAMYFTGLDPLSGEEVYVARGLKEKRMQKALLLYWDPTQHELAREALRLAGREDLIGKSPQHLVPPEERRPWRAQRNRGRKPHQGKARRR